VATTPTDGFDADGLRSMRRINGSYGLRPAADKIIGKY
jgi:hypothetical protein